MFSILYDIRYLKQNIPGPPTGVFFWVTFHLSTNYQKAPLEGSHADFRSEALRLVMRIMSFADYKLERHSPISYDSDLISPLLDATGTEGRKPEELGKVKKLRKPETLKPLHFWGKQWKTDQKSSRIMANFQKKAMLSRFAFRSFEGSPHF